MKYIFLVVVNAALVITAGCMSATFRGGNASDRLPERTSKSDVKYRIEAIDFDVPLMPLSKKSLFAERYKGDEPDFMSVLQNATGLPKDEIRRQVVKRYPRIFTTESSGVPINVRISSLADEDEWDNVGLYFCTLTLVPARRDQYNEYEIVVSEADKTREIFSVAGKMMTSFFRSQLFVGAWFCGGDNGDYRFCRSFNGNEFFEPYGWGVIGGMRFSSRGRERMRDVFIETFAFDLAKAVLEWENRVEAKRVGGK